MANSWLRLWHDMPNDPKWRTIAKVSGENISSVIAVYVHLLVYASANANERGRTRTNANEDIANALDLETSQVDKIITAMQGRVLENDIILGWDKRQVLREDCSAERAKAWRLSKKESEIKERTQSNAIEHLRTQTNETERKRTQDTDTDTEEEKDTDLKKTKAKKFSPEFEKFWEAYPAECPRKQNPSKCFSRWKALKLDKKIYEILAAIELWKKHRDWISDGGAFICAPLVFLNQGRWHKENLPNVLGSQKNSLPVDYYAGVNPDGTF